MNEDRFGLAVLTDLSASMFVACFMILLVFLSLAQRQDASPPAAQAPVEATQTFAVARRAVPSAAAMVDLLFEHAHATAGTSVDLFADRITVTVAGRPPRDLAPDALSAADVAQEPVRVYVLSNESYAAALPTLSASNRPWSEMAVPASLRDPDAPETAWRPDFLAVERRTGEATAFRAALAALVNGSTDGPRAPRGGRDGAGAAGASAAVSPVPDTLARLLAWLAIAATLSVPVAAALILFVAERPRLRAARGG